MSTFTEKIPTVSTKVCSTATRTRHDDRVNRSFNLVCTENLQVHTLLEHTFRSHFCWQECHEWRRGAGRSVFQEMSGCIWNALMKTNTNMHDC